MRSRASCWPRASAVIRRTETSPAGAQGNSPGRKPWVSSPASRRALKGRDRWRSRSPRNSSMSCSRPRTDSLFWPATFGACRSDFALSGLDQCGRLPRACALGYLIAPLRGLFLRTGNNNASFFGHEIFRGVFRERDLVAHDSATDAVTFRYIDASTKRPAYRQPPLLSFSGSCCRMSYPPACAACATTGSCTARPRLNSRSAHCQSANHRQSLSNARCSSGQFHSPSSVRPSTANAWGSAPSSFCSTSGDRALVHECAAFGVE